MCKIWLESMSSFHNMQLLVFYEFGLKNAYSRQQNWVLELLVGLTPTALPKGIFLCGHKHFIETQDSISVL